ncbi:hypothetical protein [Seleniivibrio woodruffii]|uniref:Lipoprotein n=1 Tax=Seleniivibrio woodruffii TaxID=1078050 RepID=A0A4R1K8K0_9BACT|nr:hypothetical protein [Seleniivibrio woodruffii]TCK60644.1 hypothetical protein C8D98_1523 [Seleniivibrio woodruffii]TVZ36274.1 hypothetical protein OF66_1899 [Seleniivibrio woodruffii]
MKKYFLFLTLSAVLLLSGCIDTSMKYRPTSDLMAKYDNYVKDDYLTVYYELKEGPDGKLLMMSVKNTGSIFMRNLSIVFDEAQVMRTAGYNYKSLGSLKNRSVKELSIALPKENFQSLKLEYNFVPVLEDGFLNRDVPVGHVDVEPITGTITLYFDK